MQTRPQAKVTALRRRIRNDGPNPIYKKGERNLFCPNYCQCLDYAILKSWEFWACLDCPQKRNAVFFDEYPATNAETVLYHSLPQEFYLKVG